MVLGIFWDWNNDTPASETASGEIAGLHYSGNGDNSPGIQYPVGTGEIRRVSVSSNQVFGAGTTLAVYVGIKDSIGAFVNDVGFNMFVNSWWFVNQIRVRSL